MVVIRLSPGGRKNQRIFHVCVADKDARLTGRYIEKLGQYNEVKKTFTYDKDKFDQWVAKGAIPSTRVKSLISFSEKGPLTERVTKKSKLRAKKAEKAKVEAAKAAAEEAAAAKAEAAAAEEAAPEAAAEGDKAES